MKRKPTKPSKSEQAAITAVERRLVDEHALTLKQRAEAAVFNARRQRAADRFKRSMFDQAMAAAGIDPSEVSRRQERDQAAILAFAARRRKQAIRRAPAFLERHARELAQRAKALGERDLRGPAVVIDLVDTAMSIDVAPASPMDFTYSIVPMLNIARIRVAAVSDSVVGHSGYRIVQWSFIWTPPRHGLLNVISPLSMLGISWLIVDSDCFGGYASASIAAGITVSQVGAGHDNSPNLTLLDQRISAGGVASLGEVDFLDFNEINTLTSSQLFPVSGKVPVAVTVWARLWVAQNRGQAELNFYDTNWRMNVPFVQLVLH